MTFTNLQKELANNSGKVTISICRDDTLEILFGAEPDSELVHGLNALAKNECYILGPGSSQQKWLFQVDKPQSASSTGRAIAKDLKDKGLEVEVISKKGAEREFIKRIFR